MKANRIEHRGHKGLLVIAGVVAVLAILIGLAIGYDKLRGIYLEQCLITDFASQVTIHAGKMVRAEVIAEEFGLRNGANLATIDFAERRLDLLRKAPTLKSVTISRQLPDKVTIVTEERVPVAKLGIHGYRRTTGRVVDSEGMTFVCQRGTQLLPTINEASAPGTPPGHLITGMARAALQLLETVRQPAYAELAVQDVDVSHPDFLLATLGNYSRLKITWEGMEDPTPESQADLEQRLNHLLKAIRSQVAPDTKVWNATIANRIFADTQEKP